MRGARVPKFAHEGENAATIPQKKSRISRYVRPPSQTIPVVDSNKSMSPARSSMSSSRPKRPSRILRYIRGGLFAVWALLVIAAILSTIWVLTYETDLLHIWVGAAEVELHTSNRPMSFFDSPGLHIVSHTARPLRLSIPVSRDLQSGMHQIVLPLWPAIIIIATAVA